jgi:ABC-type transporter Mla MlaB component
VRCADGQLLLPLTMLVITLETDAATLTLRLDGQLAGPGVRELARHWRAAAFKQPYQRILLDLAGVTAIDLSGKEFLRQVHRRGDRLVGGVTIRALLEEITREDVAGLL